MNKVILIGRVGKDPEIMTFENGNKMAKFSIATSKRWKNKEGEKQEKTEWHNVKVFGKTVENLIEPYIKKGQLLMVEGELETSSYEKEGVNRYSTEVVLQMFSGNIEILSKPEQVEQVEQAQVLSGNQKDENDLPF